LNNLNQNLPFFGGAPTRSQLFPASGVVKEYATATASCKGQNNMPKLIFHLQKWGQAAPEASNFRATGDGRIITWLVNRLFMRAAINRGSVRDGQTGQIRIGMST
jgi:hypothetical protein